MRHGFLRKASLVEAVKLLFVGADILFRLFPAKSLLLFYVLVRADDGHFVLDGTELFFVFRLGLAVLALHFGAQSLRAFFERLALLFPVTRKLGDQAFQRTLCRFLISLRFVVAFFLQCLAVLGIAFLRGKRGIHLVLQLLFRLRGGELTVLFPLFFLFRLVLSALFFLEVSRHGLILVVPEFRDDARNNARLERVCLRRSEVRAIEVDVVGNPGFVKVLDDLADERRHRADCLCARLLCEKRSADLVERSDQGFTFDEVILRELNALLDQTAELVGLVRSRRADMDARGIGSARQVVSLLGKRSLRLLEFSLRRFHGGKYFTIRHKCLLWCVARLKRDG